ncbi:MAG TPA: hypothetical protein DC042_02995 [Bacteroidales bacterium]|nr:hypothetical protein [Bacteroidales bacterium]
MKRLSLATFALLALYFLILFMSYYTMPSEPVNLASDGMVLLGGDFSERAPMAAELFAKQSAPLVLLANDGVRSGWSKKHQRNLYAIERSEELLVQLGVPRESIIKLPYYKSGTIYDALAVKKYASENGLRSLHLVTSDYHVYRTLWVYKQVFRGMPITMTVTGAPSSSISFSRFMEPIKIIYYKLWVAPLYYIADYPKLN